MASVAAPVIDDHVEPAAPPDITPIPAAAATRVPDVRPVHAPVVRRADVVTDVRLTVEALDVRGSLTAGQIKRALDRVVPVLRACYLPAATHAGKSPTVIVRVRFEIDESQRARSIRASGGELPELGACASRALELVRTEAPPDVGTVDVGFGLAFVPVR
jgi:hypothetical protein